MQISDMSAVRFRVENLERPLMMDDPAPRFSWQVLADGQDRAQSVWQIVVRERASGDVVWDSGRCDGNDTFGIVYDGEALTPLTAYDCVLQIWDEAGAAAEPLLSAFETGIMGGDWPANWICVPPSKGAKPPEATLAYRNPFRSLNVSNFRREFELPGPVASARLHTTALGHYRFFINGARVGDDYLTPGFTDYHQRVEYSAYDVTDMLNPGGNAIAALLGEGWYAGFIGLDMKRPGALYGRRPELSAFLTVTLENGEVFRLVTDGSWTHFIGGLIYSDMLKGEKFDARMYPTGWDSAGFDDAAWDHAGQGDGADVLFVGTKAPPVRNTQKLAAKSVTQAPDGAWVFDMGQNMVGFSQGTFNTSLDQEVKLVHAEMLDVAGNLYLENLRSGVQEDTHVGAGDGVVTYAPTFVFHGFRYVGIYGLSEKPDLSAVEGIVLNNDLEETGSFACSNDILNQLHSNIMWSQRGNFVSVPMDCPQRDERLGWTADGQVFAPTAAFNMDIQAFFTKWLDDIVDAQSEEGAFPDVAPRANSTNDGAPAWGDAGVILPLLLHQTYGDARILDRMYQPMADWIEFIRRHNPKYIRENRNHNNYGDWLAIGQETPNNMVATAYYAWIVRLMRNAAEVRGNVEDAAYYGALSDAIAGAFQREWIAEDGTIGSGSQSSYLIPLFCGVVPENLVPLAVENLVANIEAAGRRLQLGFLGVRHLCPVLTEHGHSDLAYELATSTKLPSWGYSIVNGATTIWERWDGWTHENGFQVPNMNSFNHYAYGAVGEWMFGWMAGIAPGAPGYRQIILRPTPDKSVDHCEVRYASPVGEIGSKWACKDGVTSYKFLVPANSSAELQLPCTGDSVLTINGILQNAEKRALYGGQRAILKVGSGRYQITVKYLSFTRYDIITPPVWSGLENFEFMFCCDDRFRKSMQVTFTFVFLSVPAKLIFALGVAMVLDKGIRAIGWYRAFFYLPSILGGSIAVAILWRQLFDFNGVVNSALRLFGVEGEYWLNDPEYSLYTLIILAMWQFGSPMLIFLAGLRAIPQELYEAAEIDAASKRRQFFMITVPMLAPVIFFNLVLQMIDAFKSFNAAFIISGGNGAPVDSLLFITVYLYGEAFNFFRMGYASALAWVLLLVIAAFTAIAFWTSKYWVHYEN